MENKEKYYSIAQIRDMTHMSDQSIRNACKAGRLKASQIPDSSRLGFHYLVAESDFKLWWATKKAKVTEQPKVEDLAAMIQNLIDEAYERGLNEGMDKARRAMTEALKKV